VKKILIIGANGQIGSELIAALRKKYGSQNVVGFDLREPGEEQKTAGPWEIGDASKKETIASALDKHKIDTVFHLVALLLATGEKDPELCWNLNMGSLRHVLELAKERKLQVFWPSSIAAFGPSTPKTKTPQLTALEPTTMYGVTKVAGELLCQYYHHRWGVDVRSLRYPGLISWKTPPGGGTTDYAVAIFHDALQKGSYECFVGPKTVLPMMYMPDAIRATIELMEAPAAKIKVRTAYNLAALSFSAEELALVVSKKVPGFSCTYKPDQRQKIADSWPQSIDDSAARADWGWKHQYGLEEMADDMLLNLKKKFGNK
jgi:nucleoside-diphosphate-sugar epimerase